MGLCAICDCGSIRKIWGSRRKNGKRVSAAPHKERVALADPMPFDTRLISKVCKPGPLALQSRKEEAELREGWSGM